MGSSTLPSKSLFPRDALLLIAVAGATIALAITYTVHINPEVALYRHAAEVKRAWLAHIDQRPGPRYLVFGGSSCATSIMGHRLEERYQLRVANLGLQAGMGATLLTRYALKQARPGDILIMAVEPGLLTASLSTPSLGKQFALTTGNSDLLNAHSYSEKVSNLLALRPGGYHVFTLLGKLLSHQALYRYAPGDFDVSGYQQVTERRAFEVNSPGPIHLSPDARHLLETLRSTCAQRQLGLVYALPWTYALPEQEQAARKNNLDFLLQVARFMSVLPDPKLGIWSAREFYADTFLHLTPEGAAQRTDALARALLSGNTWTAADLKRMRDSLP